MKNQVATRITYGGKDDSGRKSETSQCAKPEVTSLIRDTAVLRISTLTLPIQNSFAATNFPSV